MKQFAKMAALAVLFLVASAKQVHAFAVTVCLQGVLFEKQYATLPNGAVTVDTVEVGTCQGWWVSAASVTVRDDIRVVGVVDGNGRGVAPSSREYQNVMTYLNALRRTTGVRPQRTQLDPADGLIAMAALQRISKVAVLVPKGFLPDAAQSRITRSGPGWCAPPFYQWTGRECVHPALPSPYPGPSQIRN